MITQQKLEIFQRYGGDIDGWVLTRDATEHRVMTDADWSDIEKLRHRLWLQQHESVSPEFITETERLIAEKVSGESAVKLLHALT